MCNMCTNENKEHEGGEGGIYLSVVVGGGKYTDKLVKMPLFFSLSQFVWRFWYIQQEWSHNENWIMLYERDGEFIMEMVVQVVPRLTIIYIF